MCYCTHWGTKPQKLWLDATALLWFYTGWHKKKWNVYTLCKYLLRHCFFLCNYLGQGLLNRDLMLQFSVWHHSWCVWQNVCVWWYPSVLHCILTENEMGEKWRASFLGKKIKTAFKQWIKTIHGIYSSHDRANICVNYVFQFFILSPAAGVYIN